MNCFRWVVWDSVCASGSALSVSRFLHRFLTLSLVAIISQQGPLVRSEAQKAFSEMTFPAITLCPEARIRPNFLNMSDLMQRLPDITYCNATDLSGDEQVFIFTISYISWTALGLRRNKLEAINYVCPQDQWKDSLINHYFSGIHNINLRDHKLPDGSSIYGMIRGAAIPIDGIFFDCKMQGVSHPCGDWFKPVMTRMGMCFTFNGLSMDDLFRKEKWVLFGKV